MSPFKEPQPRKNSVEKDGEKIVGGNWPPYERQGGEANWSSDTGPVRSITAELREPAPEDWANTPLMVVPDHTAFMARTAALEAAVKHSIPLQFTAQQTVRIADIFEDYLKNGKPS